MIKNNKGFTLVETLVAISILMVAIVGPMTIVQNGLNSSLFAREEFVAQFLAQEGIEFVRNVRDNNTDTRNSCHWQGATAGDCNTGVAPADWLLGLEDCLNPDGCAIDLFNGNNKVKPAASEPILYFNNNDKTYGFENRLSGGMSKTNYSRVIKITELGNIIDGQEREIKLEVTVTWNGRSNNSYSLTTYIFNYR